MAITPLPTPVPSTDDPANFDARADAFLGALPTFATEANAQAAQVNSDAADVAAAVTQIAAAALVAADAAGFVATSTSTLSVDAGTKTIHFAAVKPKLAVATYQVAIVLASDNSIRMIGNVNTTDGSDDITVNVVTSGVSGSGSYSGPWLIIASAFVGAGATAGEMWAGLTDGTAVSPQSLRLAAAFSAITEAELVAGWDAAAKGFNVRTILTANRVVGAPANLKDGWTYALFLTQGGSGSYTASWNAVFDWGVFGAPSLSTGVGKTDQIYGQYSAATGKLHVTFRKAA